MSKHHSGTPLNEQGLKLSGYHKKLKTMKKKYFVLYEETADNPARLEYYDNEKKFKSGLAAKRVIKLKHCFNINRRRDTKYEYVIALSTKDGGFGIVIETESEMDKWLQVLNDTVRSQFEHVWQVLVQKKGLAEDKGIVGNYHVGLTSKSVTFIKIGPEKTNYGEQRSSHVEIMLTTIRRCGDSQCFFYMEVGRQSITGPGELWMETEDAATAQNMHHMILSAMSAKVDSNTEPMRKRSSSATEASKPINVLQRRQTQQENKSYNSPLTTTMYFGRERCDSLPSRNRTSSECSNQSFIAPSAFTIRNNTISGLRPHSYQRHSNSPPMSSTMGCSESEESSISIDEPDDNGSFLSYRFNSRSSEGVILEENTDELANSENKCHEHSVQMEADVNCHSLKLPDNIAEENYVSMAPVKINNKDLGEINNKLKHLKHIKTIDDLKLVPSVCSTNRVPAAKSEIDFPEYTSDNISKTFINEADSQSTRPTRAYSIGSKMEHNKVNKRIGNITNEAEQNSTIRVRAFSVGSRAKIPRCDLQRAVLCPKSTIEQNFNSNNNVCSVSDVSVYNQLLNINASRGDKKSTSAPLLIHKSHNSVDRMSDLMEIDFSKSAHNTNNARQQYSATIPVATAAAPPTAKAQLFSRSVPSSTTTTRDQIFSKNKYDTTTAMATAQTFAGHEGGKFHNYLTPTLSAIKSSIQQQQQQQQQQQVSTTDNGYLEMKPVGNTMMTSKNLSGNFSYFNNTASNEYVAAATAAAVASAYKPKMISETINVSETTKDQSQLLSNIQNAVLANKNDTTTTTFDEKNSRNNKTSLEQNIEQQQQQQQLQQQHVIGTTATTQPFKSEENFKDSPALTSAMRKYILNNATAMEKNKDTAASDTHNNLKLFNLTSKYSQLTLNSKPNKSERSESNEHHQTNNDDYINIDRKRNDYTYGENQLKNNAIKARSTTASTNKNHNKKGSYQDNGKLVHSVSDDDYKYDLQKPASGLGGSSCGGGKKVVQGNETTGYEILQIKSDSSLQSHKSQNRHSSVRKDPKQGQQLIQLIRPRSTNSSSLMSSSSSSSSSTLCGGTSSSTSCLNYMPILNTLTATTTTAATNEQQIMNSSSNTKLTPTNSSGSTSSSSGSSANKTTQICVTSRPPSVTSEHELYYASLDLPQPTATDANPKAIPKTMEIKSDSSPVAAFNVNNTYAKIDFDHSSDSSSSSSKNFNI